MCVYTYTHKYEETECQAYWDMPVTAACCMLQAEATGLAWTTESEYILNKQTNEQKQRNF